MASSTLSNGMISTAPPLLLNSLLPSSPHLVAAHRIAGPLRDVDNTSVAELSREIRYDGQETGISLVDIDSKAAIMDSILQ